MVAWVVEDDNRVAEFYLTGLKILGCSIVHRTCSIMESKEVMQEMLDIPLDIVVLDLKLSDGSGTELLPQLYLHENSPALVIATGFATIEDTVLALQHGVCDFIHKPVGMESLRAMMKRVRIRQQLQHGLAMRMNDAIETRFEQQDKKIDDIKVVVDKLATALKLEEANDGDPS